MSAQRLHFSVKITEKTAGLNSLPMLPCSNLISTLPFVHKVRYPDVYYCVPNCINLLGGCVNWDLRGTFQ